MTAQVLKAPSSIISQGGEGLQSEPTRQLLNWVVEELKAIRKSLGAASGGSGAGILVGSATKDYASLAAGAEDVTGTITVTGAALGDFCIASLGVDVAGLIAVGYVSAANTVTLNLFNLTAGAIDLGSTTIRAIVIPARAVAMAAMSLASQSNQ